jgi:hypothetical protein
MTVVTVRQAGVDTWSPAWYVDPEGPAGRLLDDCCAVPSARGRLFRDRVAGHRVGWVKDAGLLYAEGHPGGDRLGCADDLPAVLEALEGSMRDVGLPVPSHDRSHAGQLHVRERPLVEGRAGVRRLDSTADVAPTSSAEGVAIMAGVAALARDAAAVKAQVFFAQNGRAVETVEFKGHGGRKTLARWYDKGVESGSAPRGMLLRPEDQRRYVKATRRGVEELSARYVRERFHARFYPLWKASKGVTVAGPVVLAGKLLDLVESGELTPAQAEKLAGHLLLAQANGTAGSGVSRATAHRRKRQLREFGLVLSDGVLQEVEVQLADVLEAALDSDHWGASG